MQSHLIPRILIPVFWVVSVAFWAGLPVSTVSEMPPAPSPTVEPSPALEPTSTPTPSTSAAPRTSIQFLSQAPTGNWDPTHDDACEEASLMMVYYALKNRSLPPVAQADEELVSLVRHGEAMGQKPSITLAQLQELSQDFYGIQGEIRSTVTREALITDLNRGGYIIIPAAGQVLGNPYFTPPGPVYHMLVVHGYDATRDQFITHDPGTRHGANYRYGSSVLVNAIRDYDAGEDIMNGSPRYLFYAN